MAEKEPTAAEVRRMVKIATMIDIDPKSYLGRILFQFQRLDFLWHFAELTDQLDAEQMGYA